MIYYFSHDLPFALPFTLLLYLSFKAVLLKSFYVTAIILLVVSFKTLSHYHEVWWVGFSKEVSVRSY